MHPLLNGSQATERPAAKPLVGTAGWFTESGDNNIPSYPGADWFNHNIAEFQNALLEMGITFDSTKEDHLAQAFKKSSIGWVSIKNYPSLKDAISALPSGGGTVYVPVGKWYSGEWTYDTDYMSTPNVSLVGEKMPTWNSDASALVGGSIIEGRFNAFANNFSLVNIGFDMGKNVVAALFAGAPTTSPNYPIGGGTWDAFAFAQPNMASPLAQRKSFSAKNVICLCKQPDTLGHAFLAEGFDGGYLDNVIGIYSVHATVIKSQNVKFGSVKGYMSAGEGFIIKSDNYTDAGKIQGDSVYTARVLPNCKPHAIPPIPNNGVQILSNAVFTGPIQISKIVSFGAIKGFELLGVGGTDIQVTELITDGFSGAMALGLSVGSVGNFKRVSIGSHICNNSVDAVYCKHSSAFSDESQLKIGSLTLQNISGASIAAEDHGRVTVDSIDGNNINSLYKYIGNNARIIVGNERATGVSKIFDNPIALSVGWDNYGGAQPAFKARLANYGVELSGLIKAVAPLSSSVSALSANIVPPLDKRLLAYKNDGTKTFALVNVDKVNGLGIDDGTAPALNTYISLDGVFWDL